MKENKTELGNVGFIGRFKPLHIGGYHVLDALCRNANHVKIGIGSCNKYNIRNPFTVRESKEMIKAALINYSNYDFIKIPDFAHIPEFKDGQKWKEFVKEKFGNLDYFVSGNDFVRELLKDEYELLYPHDLIDEEKKLRLCSTDVRIEMARYGDWKSLVPKPVADYLENNGIVDRFRREFGLLTLASVTDYNNVKEDSFIEQYHARMM
jgi:nicotinamide-nucleotide adenylyltransferase